MSKGTNKGGHGTLSPVERPARPGHKPKPKKQ